MDIQKENTFFCTSPELTITNMLGESKAAVQKIKRNQSKKDLNKYLVKRTKVKCFH